MSASSQQKAERDETSDEPPRKQARPSLRNGFRFEGAN